MTARSPLRMAMRILFTMLVGVCGSQTLCAQDTSRAMGLQTIIVAFKTHFDIGYTDFAEAIEQKYSSSMIRGALDVLRTTKSRSGGRRFVWTLPGWPMKQILQRCDPALRPEIEQAIAEGWFAVHALPFTFETEASDLENLARGFTFSSTISRQRGLPLPRDAKLTDVPSHSWVIPTLLTHAGVRILHIGCNPASRSPEVPLLFWWEGPDGSRLLTMYWGEYYGTSLVPPEGWPFRTWLAIVHTNDNVGAPSPEEVDKVLNEAQALAPGATITIGRISDFYDALMEENPDLPVVRGDMPDTWIHGYMSMPREVKSGRSVRKDIFALESLHALRRIWTGGVPDIRTLVADAAENSLLFDEHTFGLAMSHGHSGTWCYGDEFKARRAAGVYKPIEDSWKDKGERVHRAERIITPTLRREFQELAQAVGVDGARVVVYNPLPWKRDGVVTLQAHEGRYPFKSLKDTETGSIVPTSVSGNVFHFAVRDVPPMGYRTYVPTEDIVDEAETGLVADSGSKVLENGWVKCVVDGARGALVSVVNKQNGREMVDRNAGVGFGQYLYERFGKENVESYKRAYIKGGWEWANDELGRPNLTDDPYRAVHATGGTTTFIRTKVSVSAVMQFSPRPDLPHDVTMIVTLYRNLPYLELTWSINGKPAEPWPEAGWICFPFNVPRPVFRLGRIGAVVDPAKDFVAGSNADYYFLSTGMAVVDSMGKGFGLCSPDAPGVSLERPGLWRYSKSFIPTKPVVFVNLYNNQWSTNFAEWIEGSWSARVCLWFVEDFENGPSVIIPSEELRMPLRATLAEGPPGNLPAACAGIEVSLPGVFVTAFGDNPDGPGTVLRLWEQAGKGGLCRVTLPGKSGFTTAHVCTLRGERIPGKSYSLRNGSFELTIGPYQPVSLSLE